MKQGQWRGERHDRVKEEGKGIVHGGSGAPQEPVCGRADAPLPKYLSTPHWQPRTGQLHVSSDSASSWAWYLRLSSANSSSQVWSRAKEAKSRWDTRCRKATCPLQHFFCDEDAGWIIKIAPTYVYPNARPSPWYICNQYTEPRVVDIQCRKQAPPLPLWTLVQWERRLLMAQCTVTETILLGTFLVMTWGSLRFSDAQRLDLQKIIYQDDTMRGIIWRSKTAVSGMPPGDCRGGIPQQRLPQLAVEVFNSHGWGIGQVGTPWSGFLLPLVDDQGPVYPLVPMDYATALFYLRIFLGCPWRQRPDPLHDLKLNFTLHSLKATFLSWGPQLHEKLTPEQRLAQGHHADPNSSLETDSRDVVWTSLTYQRKMIHEVQTGWRPAIAQHRGSQAPMVEPMVVLEKFVKQVQPFDFRWFKFNTFEDMIPQAAMASSESSLDLSSDSSSDEEVSEP